MKENKIEQESIENPSFQTKVNGVSQNEKGNTKTILKKLHVQKKKQRFHNKISFCQLFYCVNDNSQVNGKIFKMMRCFLCHKLQFIFQIQEHKLQFMKRIIIYYQKNGVMTLNKHVNANHSIIAQKFEQEMKGQPKGIVEMQIPKNDLMCLAFKQHFSCVTNFFSKMMICSKKKFQLVIL